MGTFVVVFFFCTGLVMGFHRFRIRGPCDGTIGSTLEATRPQGLHAMHKDS